MRTLVLPICGESSRYPNLPPKWSLKHNNKTMLEMSIELLDLNKFDKIMVIMLEKHQHLDTLKIEHEKVLLDFQTKNQVETVVLGVNNLKGQIVIKDCDNQFSCEMTDDNFISYVDIRSSKILAANKSFIQVDKKNRVIGIAEKEVISNYFCCGMYSFANVELLLSKYNLVSQYKHLYISDLIYGLLLDGVIYKAIEATNYKDWGTINEWNEFCSI